MSAVICAYVVEVELEAKPAGLCSLFPLLCCYSWVGGYFVPSPTQRPSAHRAWRGSIIQRPKSRVETKAVRPLILSQGWDGFKMTHHLGFS